jgi:hypothetical protein
MVSDTERVFWLLRIAKQAELVSRFYENYDASLDDYDTALSNLKLVLEQTPDELLSLLQYAEGPRR